MARKSSTPVATLATTSGTVRPFTTMSGPKGITTKVVNAGSSASTGASR